METSTTLKVGQKLPAFELSDEEDQTFNLLDQLEECPLILVFYRGDR